MDILLLRFDAPLMSFGAPIVDYRGVIQPYPALSMICGMLGNALGYEHRHSDRLQRLQERIRFACRRDVPGRRIRDYQTVDLNQPFMRDDRAWTTRGAVESRGGGSASAWRKGEGPPHIRLRDYWADAACTVGVALQPADEAPTLAYLAAALDSPERPLFIGRKSCLPADRILLDRVDAPDLLTALGRAPLPSRAEQAEELEAWWPSSPDADEADAMRLPVTDARDWANQIHVGERWIAHGKVKLLTEEAEDD
jgi:CRISPR system Cascade subunit CasD